MRIFWIKSKENRVEGRKIRRKRIINIIYERVSHELCIIAIAL